MSSPKKEVLTLEQTIGISSKVASMGKHSPNVIFDDGHDDRDEEFDDDHDDERDDGREGVKDDDLDFHKKRDGGAEDELEDRGGESQGGVHPKVGHDDQQHEHVHMVDCEQGDPTGMGQGSR